MVSCNIIYGLRLDLILILVGYTLAKKIRLKKVFNHIVAMWSNRHSFLSSKRTGKSKMEKNSRTNFKPCMWVLFEKLLIPKQIKANKKCLKRHLSMSRHRLYKSKKKEKKNCMKICSFENLLVYSQLYTSCTGSYLLIISICVISLYLLCSLNYTAWLKIRQITQARCKCKGLVSIICLQSDQYHLCWRS